MCVCTMLRVLICQGVYYFMFIYIYVCTILRVLICQGVYYFMFIYMCVCTILRVLNVKESIISYVYIYVCVYYVKSVNMSRSL